MKRILSDMAKKSEEKLSEMSLEDTFSKIEEVMDMLQDDDIPLEESFKLYKEGMEMLNHCREVIDGVEKKIMMISELSNTEQED